MQRGMRYWACCGTVAGAVCWALVGCTSAPILNADLARITQSPGAPPLQSLALGVLYSSYTKQTLIWLPQRTGGVKGHIDVLNYDAEYVIRGVRAILETRFGSVHQVENLAEARAAGVDLCMVLDYRVGLSPMGQSPSSLFLVGTFIDTNGGIIGKIASSESRTLHHGMGIYFPANGRFVEIVNPVLISLAQQLDNDTRLRQQLWTHGRPTDAVSMRQM